MEQRQKIQLKEPITLQVTMPNGTAVECPQPAGSVIDVHGAFARKLVKAGLGVKVTDNG